MGKADGKGGLECRGCLFYKFILFISYQLHATQHLHLRALNDTDGAIDDFEEVMEAFDLASRDLAEVALGRVAEYLGEEVEHLKRSD